MVVCTFRCEADRYQREFQDFGSSFSTHRTSHPYSSFRQEQGRSGFQMDRHRAYEVWDYDDDGMSDSYTVLAGVGE